MQAPNRCSVLKSDAEELVVTAFITPLTIAEDRPAPLPVHSFVIGYG